MPITTAVLFAEAILRLSKVDSGVVKSMTAESAQRAALGAGSIVMDVLASNDKRLFHEKLRRLKAFPVRGYSDRYSYDNSL